MCVRHVTVPTELENHYLRYDTGYLTVKKVFTNKSHVNEWCSYVQYQ